MTLIFELDLDNVKLHQQQAKYLVRILFNSKLIVQRHRHTPGWLFYLDH